MTTAPYIRYTNANVVFDYSHCTTLEEFDHDGIHWRKVEMATNLYRVNYQCGRYQSGNNVVVDYDPRDFAHWYEGIKN